MKAIKNTLVISIILLAFVSCVTQKQVKEIVATSNAAMVVLPHPDHETADDAKLKDAMERIEAVIAAHPDQAVLVNSLRVRQAMLLTVHNKPNAARIVWEQVTQPPGQRDAALYVLREELVWWFGAAEGFKEGDIDKGKKYLESIKNVCDTLPSRSNIRDYLETMRASIGFVIANETSTFNNDSAIRKKNKQKLAGDMVAYMERYAGQYNEKDQNWLAANWKATEMFSDVPVSALRARIELRRLMLLYFEVAGKDNKKLEEFDELTWRPEWVQVLWKASKQDN